MPLPTSFVVKNGSKILGLQILGDPGTIVVDFEHDRVCRGVVPSADHERAPPVRAEHRLLRVHDQIEQHLLNLVSVDEDLRKVGCHGVAHRDVADPLLVSPHRERLAHHLIEIHHGARRLPLAREGQQVAHDSRGPLRLGEDRLDPPTNRFRRGPLSQPFRPGEDRRQRIVELVRHPRDRLSERGELFGLQELEVEIAFLPFQPLALADVTNERFDAEGRRVEGLDPGGDFDPDRGIVCAPQAEQVVGDRAVGREALHECRSRLRIGEALVVERANIGLGRLGGKAEHPLEVRVGGDGGGAPLAERADVHALVHRFEEACERFSARLSCGSLSSFLQCRLPGAGAHQGASRGAGGVGVWDSKRPA